ncbi:RNA polymerase rpb4 domain-containing protein [Ditylenchus destructor]|nr:RNA polymerase rpb4 domain-containing protein [Ditylenchus destructor]
MSFYRVHMASPDLVEEVMEEDASQLKFPKELDGPNCNMLSVSEVFLLMEHRYKIKQQDEIDDMNDVFAKSLNYVRRIAKFRNLATIRSVRGSLVNYDFHCFEATQLANLCPETAEEAKSLIPSLEDKCTDEEMEALLKELQTKKNFQ